MDDWEILSANKTEELLKKNQINVTHVSALDETNVFVSEVSILLKEILDTHASDEDELVSQSNDKGISIICMNTYPVLYQELPAHQFKNVTKPINFCVTTIIREAFSNYENILLLTDPEDYKEAIIQLRTGNVTAEFRNYLGAKALNFVSAYDAGIAASVLRSPSVNEPFMNYLTLPLRLISEMKKGSNQHQEAGLYKYPYDTGALSGLSKINSEDLNYNITSDISAAWELISILYTDLKSQFSVKSVNADGYEFTTQFTPLTGTVFTVAIKFGLIVGAALSTNVLESYKNTFTYDKAITDVCLGCSSVIDDIAANEIVKGDFIAVIAPGYTTEAREILSQNKKIRLISTSKVSITTYEGRLINGGLLMQKRDTTLFDFWKVRTKTRPSQQITDEMAFGTLISLGVHSYSALLIKNHHIVGISQACTTNEMALCHAYEEAKRTAELPDSPVDDSIADILVCGAPIEFSEGIKRIIDAGVYGIIQPGGNSTDDELVQYCNDRGVVMVLTNMTHYNY